MKIAAYIRVSTDDQKIDSQLDAVKAYCTLKGIKEFITFIDHGESGKNESRPQLDMMMERVKKKEFDAVLVYKFDRISRSTKHLITIMDQLKALEVNFISITEAIDTTTPAGKMVFGIFAVLAEFERENIVARVKAGMRAAKERGVHCGRSRYKLTAGDVEDILSRVEHGEPMVSVAERYGINKGTVSRLVSKSKLRIEG